MNTDKARKMLPTLSFTDQLEVAHLALDEIDRLRLQIAELNEDKPSIIEEVEWLTKFIGVILIAAHREAILMACKMAEEKCYREANTEDHERIRRIMDQLPPPEAIEDEQD